MDQARTVDSSEALQKLVAKPKGLPFIAQTHAKEILEGRCVLDQLQNNAGSVGSKLRVACLAKCEDSKDVRVAELRLCLGLRQEPEAQLCRGVEKLERDVPSEHWVSSLVNLSMETHIDEVPNVEALEVQALTLAIGIRSLCDLCSLKATVRHPAALVSMATLKLKTDEALRRQLVQVP